MLQQMNYKTEETVFSRSRHIYFCEHHEGIEIEMLESSSHALALFESVLSWDIERCELPSQLCTHIDRLMH
jgi:hypothetical protein